MEGALVEPRDPRGLLGELDPAGQCSEHVHGLAHLAQGTAADQFQPAVAVGQTVDRVDRPPHPHRHALVQRLHRGGVEAGVDGEVPVGEEELLVVDDLGTQPVGPAHPVYAVQALDRAAERALKPGVQRGGHRLVVREEDHVEAVHETASR
ncbi:hypothetical protein ACFWZR_24555 [Streptomyces sp. NPDC059017]|uniref:hypothetical protein n=1 Tax=Streptomyces sp. NPDC059017 TaxID=3346700 RepID=UPI0036938501